MDPDINVQRSTGMVTFTIWHNTDSEGVDRWQPGHKMVPVFVFAARAEGCTVGALADWAYGVCNLDATEQSGYDAELARRYRAPGRVRSLSKGDAVQLAGDGLDHTLVCDRSGWVLIPHWMLTRMPLPEPLWAGGDGQTRHPSQEDARQEDSQGDGPWDVIVRDLGGEQWTAGRDLDTPEADELVRLRRKDPFSEGAWKVPARETQPG